MSAGASIRSCGFGGPWRSKKTTRASCTIGTCIGDWRSRAADQWPKVDIESWSISSTVRWRSALPPLSSRPRHQSGWAEGPPPRRGPRSQRLAGGEAVGNQSQNAVLPLHLRRAEHRTKEAQTPSWSYFKSFASSEAASPQLMGGLSAIREFGRGACCAARSV